MNSNVWLYSALVTLVLMHIVCGLALLKKRNDYADIVWGPGFAITALGALYAQNFEVGPKAWWVFAAVAIWGFRLFFYIGIRNLTHDREDVRYKKMREGWGSSWALKTYVYVFLLQGLLMYIITTPLIFVIGSEPAELDLMCFIGGAIWLVGFLFESIGDYQLRKFRNDPGNKGKIMDKGLWSWSRHPNYFGEVVQWWGIFLMVFPLPNAAWTVISPLTISFLILKVSGVPMLEKLMEGRPGFEEYKRRTSLFWPRPARKNTTS